MTEVGPIEQEPISYRDFEDPVAKATSVLIRIKACGVCHSTLHLIEGDLKKYGVPAKLPLIPGHEIVGVVEEKGKDVKGIEVGQKVGVSVVYETCRKCEYCKSGNEHVCPNKKVTGEAVNGGYAELLTAPYDFVYPVPAGLKDVEAAPLFCPGVTGYRSVKRAGVKPGQSVMIFGIGGVGHFSLQFAKLAGAEVIAVDRSEHQLKMAKELGADRTLLPEEVDNFVKSKRPEIVMLHTPAQAAIDKAIQVVKNKGKILWAIVGQLPLNPGGEVDIVTSMAGSKKDIKEILAIATKKKIKVVAEGYPLSDGVEILRRLKRGEITGRAVLTP